MKKELFLLENALTLIHEFLYEILTGKYTKIFLLKLSYKNSYVKFGVFSMRNNYFFLKIEALRSESVKINKRGLLKQSFKNFI